MVTIKSWEVAKLFGMEYCGLYDGEHDDCKYSFTFQIGEQVFSVPYGMGDDDAVDEDEAKEEAAKRVLLAVGKLVKL